MIKMKLPRIKLRLLSFIDTLLKSPTRPIVNPNRIAKAYGKLMVTFIISPRRTNTALMSVVIGKKKYFFCTSLEFVDL